MKKIFMLFLFLISAANLFADDDEKLKLAVMEFEDRSGTLSEKTLSDATEYIRSAFVASNKFIVIAKERQEKVMIAEMKKESYKICNDKNCQIPLGQALSADTILRTSINSLGGVYVITSELIDLEKEATVIGAKQNFDGSETSLVSALDKIAEQISGTQIKHNDEAAKAQEPVKSENLEEKENAEKTKAEEEQRKRAEERRKAAEEKQKFKDELNQAGRKTRIAVATTTLVAGVAAGVVSGISFYSMNEWKKKRSNYYQQYLDSNIDKEDDFRKQVNRADKKRKTFMIVGGVTAGVGAALIATGVVLYSIKLKGEKEVQQKYNLSFSANPAAGTLQFALNW
ncbi:hypothetical protein J6W78_01885 [bacterium]|nr:hypothetical protein [bacterium]